MYETVLAAYPVCLKRTQFAKYNFGNSVIAVNQTWIICIFITKIYFYTVTLLCASDKCLQWYSSVCLHVYRWYSLITYVNDKTVLIKHRYIINTDLLSQSAGRAKCLFRQESTCTVFKWKPEQCWFCIITLDQQNNSTGASGNPQFTWSFSVCVCV